jgi:predicted DNA-binding transcriptional regulator AlpA
MTHTGFVSSVSSVWPPRTKETHRVSTTPRTRQPHLTITDLCTELGVARSTFYDWRAAKKAPRCIKLPNGEIRIRRADFEDWLTTLEDAA